MHSRSDGADVNSRIARHLLSMAGLPTRNVKLRRDYWDNEAHRAGGAIFDHLLQVSKQLAFFLVTPVEELVLFKLGKQVLVILNTELLGDK